MPPDVLSTLTQPGSGATPRMVRGALTSDKGSEADQGPSFGSMLVATTAGVEARPIPKSASPGNAAAEVDAVDIDTELSDTDWLSSLIESSYHEQETARNISAEGAPAAETGMTIIAPAAEKVLAEDGSSDGIDFATATIWTKPEASSPDPGTASSGIVDVGVRAGPQTAPPVTAGAIAAAGFFPAASEGASGTGLRGAVDAEDRRAAPETEPGKTARSASYPVVATAVPDAKDGRPSEAFSRDLPADTGGAMRSRQSGQNPVPEAGLLAQGFAVETPRAMPAGPLPLALPYLRDGISDEVRTMVDRARTEITTSRHVHGGLTTELELAPAELGRLRLVLQTGERGLHLRVLVDRPESIDLVRRHLEGLHRILLGEGVRLDGVDIATSDREQGAGDKLRQQMGAEQQPDRDRRMNRDTPPRRDGAGGRDPSEDGPQPRGRPSGVRSPGSGRLDIHL